MTRIVTYTKLTFILIIVCSIFSISFASSLTSKPEVQSFINDVAKKYDFSPYYIKSILNKANYNPEVIQKIETPYEAKPWYQYRTLFVNQERIDDGIKFWSTNAKLVAWEQTQYNVPGSLALAIIGIETKYGTQMGDFRVLDALTTLAFNYPPQAALFQKELGAFIAMIKAYNLNPTSLLGSYAGAMGQCQFMPSSYLDYAVAFQTDNVPNLFTNSADAIFSIGNYLRQHGWEPEQPVAVPAKISGTGFQSLVKSAMLPVTDPTMPLAQLAHYGVYPTVNGFDQRLPANLISFQGENGPEYWIIFHNFYVLTTYNVSSEYAMAAFQLSLLLQHTWDAKQNIAGNSLAKKYNLI